MQKIVTINLNGAVYQLDENAYRELRAYLDEAEARLSSNLDRTEIIADLEQAISERCARVLGPGKSVVTKAEVDRIIAEIGPVEAGAPAGDARAPSAAEGQPKRLYQIREGAMISGVCNGLGAYMNIDPTIIRIAFVALAFVTGGASIIAYLVLMFMVPYAKTSDQLAAAQGPAEGLPYRVQQVVEKIKDKLSAKPWKWKNRTS